MDIKEEECFEDIFGGSELLDDEYSPDQTASTECCKHRAYHINGKVLTTKSSDEQEGKITVHARPKDCKW